VREKARLSKNRQPTSRLSQSCDQSVVDNLWLLFDPLLWVKVNHSATTAKQVHLQNVNVRIRVLPRFTA
jgi:hypothetical protein